MLRLCHHLVPTFLYVAHAGAEAEQLAVFAESKWQVLRYCSAVAILLAGFDGGRVSCHRRGRCQVAAAGRGVGRNS